MSSSTIKYKRVFTTNGGSGGSGGGIVNSIVAGRNTTVDNTDPANPIVATTADDITVVANYSALPAVGTVTGEFYWCSASQGTSWLPGALGGTYYSRGLYYSNGVTWEFMDVPYQATQSEVNTGTNTDKFVTPATLTSWTGRALTVGTTGINSGATTRILYDNAGVLGEYTITGTGTVVAMQTSPAFLTSTSITAITATTSSNDVLETLTNNSSGTPAASYGLSRLIQLKTTTTDSQTAGKEIFSWATATHASRQSQYAIQLVGNASVGNLQDAFKIVANGNSFKFQFVNHIGYDPRVEFLTGTAMRAYIENSGDNLTFNTVNSSSAYFSWRAGVLTDVMRLSTTGLFVGGNVAATAALQVRKTTEQFRVEYDASNYYSTTVGSTGGVIFNAVGSGSKFTFSDNIELTQTVTTETVVSDTTVTIVINGTTYKLLARA